MPGPSVCDMLRAMSASNKSPGFNTPIGRVRLIGMIEGVSFVLLLGIAMPLKYLADMPMAVRIVGMAHGVLFLAFCAALAHAWATVEWPLKRGAMVFLAALVPFGPFLIDGRLRDEDASLPQE